MQSIMQKKCWKTMEVCLQCFCMSEEKSHLDDIIF